MSSSSVSDDEQDAIKGAEGTLAGMSDDETPIGRDTEILVWQGGETTAVDDSPVVTSYRQEKRAVKPVIILTYD